MSASRSPRRPESTDATDATGTTETTTATDTTGTTGATRTAAIPLIGTGAGPKPDPTTFARATGEPDDGRRRATTRPTDDDAAE